MLETNGARESVEAAVTGQVALDIGRALGSTVDSVVVGHDGEPGASALSRAARAGIQEAGSDVVDVGRESAPTVARSVDWYDTAAGLAVTPSQDGAAVNTFTLWSDVGLRMGNDHIQDLLERAEDTMSLTVRPAAMGSVRQVDGASDRHLEALEAVECGPLSVVVDLGSGTGQLTVEALRALGCNVATINGNQGHRVGESSDATTTARGVELRDVVADSAADMGIAHVGDADRLVAVDETGRAVSGDELLALFALELLPRDEAVAAPVTASALVDAVVGDVGGSVVRTAIGADAVATACAEEDVVFGGTPSGAWIWPDETLVQDGHYAACRLAAIVASGSALSDRIASFPTVATDSESVRCADPSGAVAAVGRRAQDQYDTVTTVDGVRVDLDDGWFLVRDNDSDPLVWVTAEARTERRAEELRAEATGLLEDDEPVTPSDGIEASRI